MYNVKLNKQFWLMSGSWNLTIFQRNAKRYKTRAAAKGALTRARHYRPYEDAEIIPIGAKG